MARDRDRTGDDGAPRPRFGRSGHTAHTGRGAADPPAGRGPTGSGAAPRPPGPPGPPRRPGPRYVERAAVDGYDEPTFYVPPGDPSARDTQRLPDLDAAHTSQVPLSADGWSTGEQRPSDPVAAGPHRTRPDLPAANPPPPHRGAHSGPHSGPPSGPQSGAGGAPPRITVTRAVASRSQQAARYVTNKVVAASRADGASESGLTQLIWNQVLSFSADAMITVALAGTVFFSAAKSDQRGNVLGYLLITMLPFAIVAPVIGPVLDRLQHGRRWAMAASAFGRAVLSILMAQNFDNLFMLFPLALGSLVLSKAYSVVRAAAAPRLVPPGMTLVTANARLSLFGLGAMLLGGGLIGVIIKLSGSYWFGLWLTSLAFIATGVFALKLPKQVDAPTRVARPMTTRADRTIAVGPRLARLRSWAGRGYGREVLTALQGACTLRWTTGFLTLFLAFWVQSEQHGFDAVLHLGAIGAGVGAGNAVGTAIGARAHLGHPDRLVVFCAGTASLACIGTSIAFGIVPVTICMFITAAVNSLGKVSLDAVIQRDISETYRSSAFARSETFLQLSWVIGAAIGILLPMRHGALGLGVAACVTAASVGLIVVRRRLGASATVQPYRAPGTV